MSSRKVVVTGAAGFIGSHLVSALLVRGYEVIAYDNLSMGRRENVDPAARLIEGDVRDVPRLPGIYPAEFCDDCGAPYFPNPLGEMLHPEFPEEADPGPIHFH